MNIYEIDKEMSNLLQMADERGVNVETGEIVDNYAEYLDKLTMERDQKVENIACYIKNLTSDERELDYEIKMLTDRKKIIKNKRERLTKYLCEALHYSEKFNSARCSVGWRKTTAVQVNCDVSELPEEFRKETITVAADKIAIKNALKADKEIKGCELVENQNIQIK